ncbi:hypothetical protein [Clostridium rectalis]|uniref:hypothetical protein n=1 Tax=Clostridium rectalis TaxID=2040295 RepID=UPI000F63BD4F|nr:hypothetical protein [Clostridium rectalis]
MKKYIINNTNNLTFQTRDKADEYAEEVLKLKKYIITDKVSNQIWEYELTKTGYKYRISSLQASSSKYGKCKCCGKHVSEVFLQDEARYLKYEENEEIDNGYTCHRCNNYVGHKECLEAKRR